MSRLPRGQHREPCGCVVSASQVIEECAKCRPVTRERHERAQRDYRAAQAVAHK